MGMKRSQVIGAAIGVVLLINGACRGALSTTLAWEPSLTDVDGHALVGAVGYKLFLSNSSGVYSQYLDVGSANVADVTGLEYNKTYFFRAKAYTTSGESAYSEEVVWVAPAMPDVDGDGISDNWEMKYFGSLDVAQGSTDSDNDGIPDRNEFLAGTDPTGSDGSVLVINNTAAGAHLSFQARQASGIGYENRTRYYTLKQCENLATGIWTSVPGLENIPALDQTVSVAVSSDIRSAFYCTEIRLN